MSKLEKLTKLFKEANEKEIIVKDIEVFGYQFNYNYQVLGSVSKYWFGKHEVTEFIAPLNKDSGNDNRPGTKKASTQYIVVHDTASAAESANALAHAKYVSNGGGGTSWHYSSGSDGIYHQIPDDEIAYHAGDQLIVPFSLTNTNVKGNVKNPSIDINNGYYYINGEKSSIKAPVVTFEKGEDGLLYYASDCVLQSRKPKEEVKEHEIYKSECTSRINEEGIRIDLIGDTYYMGPTYYSSSYECIANRGGNLNSIGIETMVNKGSDLYLTWHKTAKLVAHLLKDNNLDISRVKPHHFFSGKDCPMTMRHAGLWKNFLELVKYEYEILMLIDNTKIEFICDNDLIDNTGRLIKLPIADEVIKYSIKVTNEEGIKIIDLETMIKLNNNSK